MAGTLALGAGRAAAEGSATLIQSGGYRPFLEYRNDFTQNSALHRRTIVKVFANSGDTLLLASSANGSGGGRLRWRSPNGASGLAPTNVGVIANLAAEQAGPLPAAGGYTPYRIAVGAAQTGVWEIDFVSPDSTSNLNPPQVPVGNAWTQRGDAGYVSAWDVTVRNSAGVTIPGRAYVTNLAMNMGGPNATLSSQIYLLTRDGFRYRMDVNNAQPFGFNLFANNKGFRDAAGLPLYHSVELAGARVHDPDAADTPTDVTHKVFFNAPAADLPASANTPSGTTWLITAPFVATISNFRFTGVDGTEGQAAAGIGGTFSFQSTGTGNYVIRIDLDGNGTFTDPVDRALVGIAVVGTNNILWNGLDGLGARAGASGDPSNVKARVTLLGGEVHFPYIDAENNTNGMIIERQSGAGAPDYTIHYDDTPVGGVASAPVVGENSAAGGHRWSNFLGDVRGMDTWAYVPGASLELETEVVVRDADLELVSKTHTPEPLVAGQDFSWTIVTRNNGPDSVFAATVLDTVDSRVLNLTLADATHVGGAILGSSITANVFRGTIDLPPGGTATFVLAGTVSPSASGALLNRALALRGDDQGDADDPLRTGAGNNSKRDTANVIAATPDIAVDKSHVGATFVVGALGTWNVAVSNVGNAPTSGAITVVDTLPAGQTVAQAFASDRHWEFVISPDRRIVTATYNGVMAAGAGAPFTIQVNVGADAIPSSTNWATGSTPGDVNPTNDRDSDTVPISAQTDLAMDKSHAAPFQVGSNGTWTFTVSNLGPASTIGTTTVLDTLPAGVTYVSGFGEGWLITHANGQVIARYTGPIAPNTQVSFDVVVAVNEAAYPAVINFAQVLHPNDTNPDNNRDRDLVPVTGLVNLTIDKSHAEPLWQSGATGNYTIVVGNTGNIPSSGTITVRDTLPAGLTFASATNGAWSISHSAGVVTATTNAAIAPGGQSSFTFTVNVFPVAAPSVINSATVYGGGDGDSLDNRDDDPTAVRGQPDMTIDKSHTGTFTAGQNANWRLFVQNVGNAPAVNPVVRDTLPAGVTFVSGTNPAWTFGSAGNVVTASYAGSLAPGESQLFTLNVLLASVVSPTITNVAAVEVSGDSDPSNNRDTDPAATNALPELSLDKSHTGSFDIGQNGTWNLLVRNTGAGPTIGATSVQDSLPAGVTFVSGSGSGWVFSHSNGVVTATHAGVIPAGGTAAFDLVVSVQAAAYPSVTNIATVLDGGDITPDNNRDTDTVPVRGSPNLVIDKRHTAAFSAPGSGTYTIVITNVGNLPTSGAITVRDTLPAGLTFTSGAGAGFTVGAAGGVVTATTNASIAVGDSARFDVVVAVDQTAVPAVTNAATVSGGGDITPVDNRDTDFTPVAGTPDLQLDKTHSGAFTPGLLTNWRVEVRNVGTVTTTTPTTVRDTLPAGVTFSTANGTGWTFSFSAPVLTATHTGNIAAGGTTFFLVNIRPTSQGVPAVTNTATVYNSGDLNPANDRDTDTAPVNPLPDLAIFKRHAGELSVGGTTVYTLTIRNVGAGPTLGAAAVLDTLPTGLSFLRFPETGNTGWTTSATTRVVGGTYTAILAPGDSATFSFVAAVEAAAVPTATNTAVVSTTGDEVPSNDRAIDRAPVTFRSLLSVNKTASPELAQLGDVIDYTVQVRNDGNVPVGDLVVNDRLPAGFVYLNGSARVGGTMIADPDGAPGAQLAFHIGFLDAARTLTLRYRVAVGAGANIGRNLNVAVASSRQRNQTSPPASAAVEVRGGVFGDEGIITGKMYVDCDCEHDGTQGHEELGIPGVRLFLEDGTSVVTDVEGKYHFPNVRPRTHVLRADTATLPAGAKLSAFGTRHAGEGTSMFVDIQKGELFHADFAEISHDPAVVAEVKARRERGEVGSANVRTTVTSGGDGGDVAIVTHDDGAANVTTTTVAIPAAGAADSRTVQVVSGDADHAGTIVRVVHDGQLVDSLLAPAGAVRLPFVMTGLLEGRIDLRSKGDRELGGYPRDRFMDEFGDIAFDSDSGKVHGGARGALYGTGDVGRLGTLTLRYDTEADPNRRFLRDIRPDDGYDVWGDASLLDFGARSQSRLYASLQKGESFATFGDVSTRRDAARQLGAYDRSFNGATGAAVTSHLTVGGFASRGRSHQVIDELPGRGISGPYALTRTDAVLNSERVELVTRDRSQPARIVSRVTLTRFADYTVEAFTGRLLFRRPVPGFDSELNPVSIRVTYETESLADEFWVAGGHATVTAGKLSVGGAMSRDDDPARPRDLASVNATLRPVQGVELVAEYARSDSARGGFDATNSEAKRAELSLLRGNSSLHAWALRVDGGFDNPSAGATPGREELGGTAKLPLGSHANAFATAIRTRDLLTGGQRQGIDVGLSQAIGKRLRLNGAFRSAEETNTPASALTAGTTPSETKSLRGRLTTTLPRNASAFGEFEQDLDVTDQRRFAVGADAPLVPGVRAYVRHENNASFAGPFAMNGTQQQASTVLGIAGDGAGLGTVYGEYRARDAFAGRDAQAAMGLRHRWEVSRGLRLDGSFERLTVIRGGAGEATSVATGIEYTRDPLWKGTARVELRSADGAEHWLATGGVARKLSRDWTALARAHWTETSTDDEAQARFGVAYRRTDDNRLDALARWEVTRRHPGLAGDYQHEHVASAHAAWQASRALAIDGQLAARWLVQKRDDFKAHTALQLASGRARWQFAPPWDAGLTGRVLTSNHFDEKQFGTGVELGRALAKNVRASIGWNLFGFRSAGLSTADVTDAGPYVGFGWKFDESLFGGLAKGGESK